MLKKFLGAAASTVILFGASQASAAVLVIDAFDGEQLVQDAPSTDVANNDQVADSGVLGGYRDLAVKNTYATGNNRGATELRVTDGMIKFSNISGAKGTGTLTYDGDDDATVVNTTGLGGINLLIGTDPYFYFGLPGGDDTFDNIASFTATVWDMAGNTFTYTEVLEPGFSQELAFSAFTGIDFSQIGALQFFISTAEHGPSVDGALNLIEVRAGDIAPIPLPASGLLLLGGFGGLAALRRRKKA